MMAKDHIETRWTGHAFSHLVGRAITAVRYLTNDEAEDMGWHQRPLAVFLTDGTILYPASDEEGNAAGVLFGERDGKDITFPCIPMDERKAGE